MDYFGYVIVMALLIGVFPGLLAHSKGENFLKWWLFGAAAFIIAFPMALLMKPKMRFEETQKLNSGDYKKCPYCAELIKIEAKVCRYCSRDVDEENQNNYDDLPEL